jgi:phenylacetate-CoA ligase
MNEAARIFLTALSISRHGSGSRERIQRFQNRKLRQLVEHAYDRVPYYRELFDRHGISPADIRTVADLTKIPITTKSDIRGLGTEHLVARGLDVKHLFQRNTTGVTGHPLTVWRTRREEFLSIATIMRREARALGMRRGDRVVMVKAPDRGRPPREAAREKPGTAALRRLLLRRAGADRIRHINAFLPVDEIIESLRDAQPDVLTGYAGVLWLVAQRIESLGETCIKPRMVITGAETVTPAMREQLSRAFKAPVYDTYGAQEFSRIATQCIVTGEYHVCDDSVLVEILAADRPAARGETGTVIATNLHSFAMPFIRFELGDLAVQGRDLCACGVPFPTLLGIQGRMIDHFPMPDGSDLHPWRLLDAAWPHLDWIAQYRFVQETTSRVVMLLAPRRNPTDLELSDLEQREKKVLGSGVEFICELVEQIELDPTGKLRPFRSLVHSTYA